MISNVAISSPESYYLIISAGFGMMGSHRDIAEDLNEYRVRNLVSHMIIDIRWPILYATHALDLVCQLACM